MGLGLSNYIVSGVYVLTFLVAFLTIFYRIECGLLYLVFFLPLQNILQKLHDYPLGKDFVDIIIIALLIRWLVGSSSGKSKVFKNNIFTIPILFYIAITFVGFLNGAFNLEGELPTSFSDPRFMAWKNLILLPILYLITVNNVRDNKWIKLIVITALLSMFLSDYFFIKEFRWFKQWHYSHDMRIAGPFTYLGPNELGAFFAQYLMIPLALFLYTTNHLERILIGLVSAFTLYCLMYTYSRAGYLAFVVGLTFILLIKNKKLLLLYLTLLLISPNFLPVSVTERIQMTMLSEDQKIQMETTPARESDNQNSEDQKFESSIDSRFDFWEIALEIFKQNPILGSGLHTFIQLTGRDTHNNYLKTLAELGLFGFSIYLYLYYLAFKSGWQLYRISKEKFSKGLGLGFAVCVLANIIVNITHDNWTYINLMGFYWIFWALVVKSKIIIEQEAQIELV